ncbi:hypothetical protein Elgi_09880 [Paenibacillus elgii]|uniref:hypothetical protein n=1 Tax=Paenibacillus elgii TaxID=189691 RepID=UPI002D7BA329|nr:hypothetical protein Elgi_09880 [Paenibacillus elgii]
MNIIMNYLIFFLTNFVVTYFIFPEPSFARSLLYSVIMTIFVAILDAIKKKPKL